MTRRGFYLVFLVAALLIAGVASYYASAHPDGLLYVAERTGFLDSAEDSPTSDSPLAHYRGGGLAGVIGVLMVLLFAGGLAWLLRRRGDEQTD